MTDNRTTEATLPSGRCSNPECPLNRAHSGPCAPQEWTGGDAVVLAAKYLAQAASDWSDTETDEHSHSLECTNWEAYQQDAHDMRAALVAAQGAAPQAESEPYRIVRVLHEHQRDTSVTSRVKCVCGVTCGDRASHRLHQAELIAHLAPAPVLPSSTESPVEPFKTWFACWWKNEPNAIAESNAQSAFYAGWDARGLPSSGVDEDARSLSAWPTVDEVRETFKKSADRIAFGRMIAEVERAAAARALEEFADQMTTGFNAGTLNAERRAIKREARARAEAYRQERGEQ